MTNLWVGAVAGFVATAALSILMLLKRAMHLMPELDMIGMLSKVTGTSRGVAWLSHFAVGTLVYGVIFAWLSPALPGEAYWVKGVVWAVFGWLIAMTVMMPLAGQGLFAMKIGVRGPAASLMMHMLFGAVLGWALAVIARAALPGFA